VSWLPSIKADATQLRQVVMNLITNASDAIGERSGVITVTTGLIDADLRYLREIHAPDDLPAGRYVYLEVSDNGCGMPDAVRERIFDPFFTTKFTGRGLGLAATLGIVRGHDGAIGVRSRPGSGTSMSLYFPISSAVPREASAGTVAPLSGHGAILVVDDDDGVRAVARALLQRQGFRVILAANGQEAVAQFAAHRAEVRAVLLDLTMPVMGGEEALRRLRETDPTVRVVLMSGYSDVDVEGTFASAGLSGFLQKPFRADDVYRTLSLALADS
jgi:two-component system, cell cycle sensor histidine kinase and response regulator CckA